MTATATTTADAEYEIEVFYDGDCPLCHREISLLRRWDRKHKVRFTNIADPQFRSESIGKSFDELMAKIYGRLPNGELISGVEVFRRLYAAVGFGPLIWFTRLPLISQTLDLGYRLFAKNRLRLTGRCNAESCSIRHAPASVATTNTPADESRK